MDRHLAAMEFQAAEAYLQRVAAIAIDGRLASSSSSSLSLTTVSIVTVISNRRASGGSSNGVVVARGASRPRGDVQEIMLGGPKKKGGRWGS